MASNIDPALLPFVRKIESIYPLTPEAIQAFADLPMQVRDLRASQDIVRNGDRPRQCCLLLDGFVCRYSLMADGRRQILSFHISGDILDLLTLHLRVMDHNLGTMAPSRVAFIPHDSIHQLIRLYPRIGNAFWRDTLIDAAVSREWMVGMGRRSAHARTAHLICEIMWRMRSAGLASGNSVQLPFTQADVGDALGLSTVHVNRVLQVLRGEGLITWNGKALTVENWDGLRAACDFDPVYLHLTVDEAA